MAQTTVETAPAALRLILVTFSYGSGPTINRYVRGTENVTSGGNEYIAAGSIKVDFTKPNQGGVEDSPITVALKATLAPYNRLILDYPHATVTVTVEEMDYGNDSSRKIMFKGRLSKITYRPNQVEGLAVATVVGIKARLVTPLSLQLLPTCPWQFGTANHSLCKKDIAGLEISGQLDERDIAGHPTRIHVDFASSPDLSNERWARGYAMFDGCPITIRQSLENGYFDLKRPAPPYWMAETITLYPGCRKTIEACRYWENEEHFGGAGIAMPDHNPVFEE